MTEETVHRHAVLLLEAVVSEVFHEKDLQGREVVLCHGLSRWCKKHKQVSVAVWFPVLTKTAFCY